MTTFDNSDLFYTISIPKQQTYKTALAMHRAGWDYAKIAKAMGIQAGSAMALVQGGLRFESTQPGWLSQLTVRTSNALKQSGYEDRAKLVDAFKSGTLKLEINAIPGIGLSGMKELVSVLRSLGDDIGDAPKRKPATKKTVQRPIES